METITSKEFVQITRENPDWADVLEKEGKPIGIIGRVEMSPDQGPHNHPIRKLSPLMHFLGETVPARAIPLGTPPAQGARMTLFVAEQNRAAEFRGCSHLKVAAGTFHGFVSFDGSGIERIDPAKLVFQLPPEKWTWIASLQNCLELEIAEGTFPGAVSFNASGVKRIRNLKSPNLPHGLGKLTTTYRATFNRCDQLEWCDDTITQDGDVDLPRAFRIRMIDAMAARNALAKGKENPAML